jgi:hypothetical protein
MELKHVLRLFWLDVRAVLTFTRFSSAFYNTFFGMFETCFLKFNRNHRRAAASQSV